MTETLTESSKPYGIVAEFTTAASILHAAELVKNAGFRRWDVYTPFPVHGMDKAMGLRNSKVGWFTFVGGVIGYASGMIMIWYMNAFDYPLVIGGKPMFSPYSAFPPSFELTILFGAFGSLIGMLFLNRLPRLYHPLLKNKRFSLVTHDRFYVVIECDDPKYSEVETRRMLEEAGSRHIEVVED
jgi:Alternative complex III, ActD subunit